MTLKHGRKGLTILSAAFLLSAALTVPVWAKDRLETVDNLYWDGDEDDDASKAAKAVWEEVEDAYQYKVRLYRDDSSSIKAEITTKKTSYNFKRYMTTEGEYTFKVQALAKSSSKEYLDSHWSEESDSRYVSSARADSYANKKQEDTSKGGPGAGSGSSDDTPKSGVVNPDGSVNTGSHLPIPGNGSSDTSGGSSGAINKPSDTSRLPEAENKGDSAGESGQDPSEKAENKEPMGPGQWVQDNLGWWYRQPDGTYPAGQWFQDPKDLNWYKFDGQGYMMTGWIIEGKKRYYCDPDGSPAGAMATGERTINGVPYTFDSSGVMKDDYIPSVGSSSDD